MWEAASAWSDEQCHVRAQDKDYPGSRDPSLVAPASGPPGPPSRIHLVAPALSARCAGLLPSSSHQPAADGAAAAAAPAPRSRALLPRTSPDLRRARRSLGASLGRPREPAALAPLGLARGRLPSSARGAAAVVAAAPGMYQSPRRLCSALLQRDAPRLRRLPARGLRLLSPPPAAAPRPASPRLLAAASAVSGAARSCSRTALGEGKDNFVQCPVEALKWEERKCLILEEILAYQPDILCLQEVDHYFDTFQPLLSRLGYQGTFFPKPWSPCLDVEHNNGPDGCALFFLQNRFKLVNSANIRLTAMTLKTNQVAIAQTLECKESSRQFCIAVTHLKARTGWERFRSAQGCDLLQNLQNITQGAKIPLIVCGDFNAEPTEEVYKHFASSSLNLNSAYKLLSADGQSEPPYTTWKIRTSGECRHTLDYIWYSKHALSVRSALDLLTEEQIGPNRLPSFNYPSDHLSLVCDFSFNEEPDGLL
uniref:Nocturnin n=1 Tax=Equus caballus TaxID=9796 RepID=A0A9L0R200_HORSE